VSLGHLPEDDGGGGHGVVLGGVGAGGGGDGDGGGGDGVGVGGVWCWQLLQASPMRKVLAATRSARRHAAEKVLDAIAS
jgi:hypothetical protein